MRQNWHLSVKLWPFEFFESVRCSISSVSIYYFVLNRTSESKVMVVWIFIVIPCLISGISIYYAPESDIRLRDFDHLNFLRAFVVQFRESRYIIGLDRTSESKVVAVWICLALWCLISSMSIYYAPESDISVKRYDHMSLSRAFVVQFRESSYIIGLNRTSESKVMAHWTSRVLPCLISSFSIYYAP